MQVFKHWHKLEKIVHDADGREWDLRAWGGSPVSEDDAKQRASAKLQGWIAKLSRGVFPFGDYEYQMQELREELIEEIHSPSGELIAAITRNRYGALVLNAANVFIADLDAERPSFMTKLLGLFGRKSRDKEFQLTTVREYVESHAGVHAVVYETKAGLRAFFTHKDYDPAGEQSRSILTTLGSDRLYQKLCTAQKCYRARLTPKPWRCSATRPPRKFPRASDQEQSEFQKWLTDYETKAAQFTVCRKLEEFGTGKITAHAEMLLAAHDRIAVNDGRSELA